LNAAKSIIMSVLGLLTPQDLKRITLSSEGVMQQAAGAEYTPFSSPAHMNEAEQGARVLDFPTPEGPSSQSGREFLSQQSTLETIGVMSADKQAELKKAAKEAYEKSQPDTLDFILTERDRFKHSEERIHKQNGLSCYKKNADMRLFQVVSKDNQGNKKRKVASVLGILVDKKQT
jgi:hypothetical protein